MITKTSYFMGVVLIAVKLFFNKKLNWSYIHFGALILSLLLLSTNSSAFERRQHKLFFHLNTLGASGTSFSPDDPNDEEQGGYGISYDFVNKRGHSFAIEGHSLPSVVDGTTFAGSLSYLGYRYHTNGGLYFGLGFIQVSKEVAVGTCKDALGDLVRCSLSLNSGGIGASLGYTYVFDSGFTLGVSSLYKPESSATATLETDSPFGESITFDTDLDLGAQNVGLVVGYTWR